MKRPDSRQADAVQRYAKLSLGVIAVLFVGRACWLYQQSTAVVTTCPEAATKAVFESESSADPLSVLRSAPGPTRKRLTEQEFASIAGLCPTAVSELPQEILPLSAIRPPQAGVPTADDRGTAALDESQVAPPHRLTSTSALNSVPAPRGRLTGVRIASNDSGKPKQATAAVPDGWLVAPEQWFVPEDGPPAATAPPAKASEEALDQPLVGPLDEASDEPQGAVSQPETTPLPPEEGGRAISAEVPAEVPMARSPAESPESDLPAAEAFLPRLGSPASDLPTDGESPTPPESRGDDFKTESEFAVPAPAAGATFAPPGVSEPLVSLPPASAPVEPSPNEPESTEESEWAGPFDRVAPQAESPTSDYPSTPLATELPDQIEADRAESTPRIEAEVTSPSELGISDPENSGTQELRGPAIPSPSVETIPPPQPTPKPARLEPPIPPKPSSRPLFTAPLAKQAHGAAAPTSVDRPPGALHPGAGPAASAAAKQAAGGKSADESHRELFAKNNYPSAQDCAKCHERIYDEWRVSSHAYAFVSPMYHKFEQTISTLSQGTVGHFCQRCHSPVATAMYEPRSTPIGQMAKVAREGVTCIACHRVNQRWGKSNGERRIVPGDIYDPVYGGVGGEGVAETIADRKKYKVKTSPEEKGPGQAIHTEGRFFDQLTRAEACTSCHQVAVHPGVKLEVVWEQYRASPACKKGITCQDCHMGRIPGVAAGYNYGPIAELNGKTVDNNRKQSSHIFYGPGYSIAHPGIFPHNADAEDWTVDEWLLFDWRAGWGTDEFEDKIEEHEDNGTDTAGWFPPVWAEADDRYDAREIIGDNLEHLAKKRRYRELVMENGSKVDGPFFRNAPVAGQDLEFDYVVANLNEGHNLPTASLGAQPQLWANVVLIDPAGRRVWESGYTDSNGDLCDIHSVDVRKGRIPFDRQLFNLQTMFLITGATGTDREFYLPVNFDFDQVPHLRPGTVPVTVLNHPPFIRMEMRSLSPLGKKRVKYTVPGELMRQRGRYRLSFRMRNRTEPMYFMRLCESTPEMLRAMTEGTLDIHPQSVEFDVY